jgi:hypothetical protein
MPIKVGTKRRSLLAMYALRLELIICLNFGLMLYLNVGIKEKNKVKYCE